MSVLSSKAKTAFMNSVLALRHYKCYKACAALYKRNLKLLGIANQKAEGEEAYVKKWQALSSRVGRHYYRLFRKFVGNTPNIVPEDIGHFYIEPVLNPVAYRAAYADKNLFPKIIGKDYLPRTVLCRINGGDLLDADYNKADDNILKYAADARSLILKPSTYTRSGWQIMRFDRQGDTFVSKDGTVLTTDFLLHYRSDFCLQETIVQHAFMQALCATSVNTIRLGVYRSVVDNEPKIIGGCLKVGRKGSIIDNNNAGGMLVGVDMQTGELGKYVLDVDGRRFDSLNGVNFAMASLQIPHWDEVLQLAKLVSRKVLCHRLLTLDIALRDSGKPALIEYNIEGIAFYIFMLVGQLPFGEYTDEIINYCKDHRHQAKEFVFFSHHTL